MSGQDGRSGTRPPRVFISYSHQEEPLGRTLKESIEKSVADSSVFLSSVDLELGERWLDELELQLAKATHVILVCSPQSVDRPWLNFEAGAVLTSKKPVIPVCHSGQESAHLPERFQRYHGLNLVNPDALKVLIEQLGGTTTAEELALMWSDVEVAISEISYEPPRPKVGQGPQSRFEVLVDKWHGQDWEGVLMTPAVAPGVREETEWTFQDVERGDEAGEWYPELGRWSSMILTMPHDVRMSDDTVKHMVRWVHEGGRLAVFGFELGERHHNTNLNVLLDHFGVHLNTDIVAPTGWAEANDGRKPYGRRIAFDRLASREHPLLSGVSTLLWSNVQSMSLEPGSIGLVLAGDNPIGHLKPDSVTGYSGEVFRSGDQEFDFTRRPDAIVAGLAADGLTGAGAVLAVGTWQIFETEAKSQHDNPAFFVNVLRWLTAERDVSLDTIR